jgi:RNA polymerase sigma-70 factor (ECF subfamily)
MDDLELLRRFQGGEVSAFEALLERYEQPLLRYVARYQPRGAQDLAQDLVQEVFLRLVRETPRLNGVENLSAWLYRVARNIAIDAARKEERMERRNQLAASPEVLEPPESAVEKDEVAQIVAAKLMGLPPQQRDVLILKIQEQKSYREISAITGLTPSNVGYLIHRGLKSLAGELRTAGVI